MITFDTHPDRYRHWKLQVEGAVATLVLDVAEDGGIKPGYKLKLNSYDLGVDIELHDALNRIRFEHPEVRTRRAHQRQGAHVLRRRQHLHAGRVVACLEGQFLQVHQRDAQRHRGFEPQFRPQIPRRAQRHLRRRRLRARARLRRDRHGRRPLLDGEPAGSAAARRAARHRRPDAPGRQAQGAARPRRCVLHHRRGRARRPRQGNGSSSTTPRRRQRFADAGAGARARRWRRRATGPPTAAGVTLPPLDAPDRRRRAITIAGSMSPSTATERTATITVTGPAEGGPRDARGDRRAGRSLVAARHGARARRRAS